jgi:dTDP-4-dehydrorhamnose reductase
MSPAPSNSSNRPLVVGVTATYRRPVEVERLLRSLEASDCPLHALVIVDNAGDPAIQALASSAHLHTEYLSPGTNLGCGGGLHAGERLAMEKFGGGLTHLWILDDDAVIEPGTLGILLAAMAAGNADTAHPLVIGSDGMLGWFPGLLDPVKFQGVKERQTPDEFIVRCGLDPVPFSWAQGIALLVTRRAIETLGFHRTDFWVRGEDLEFSLRITKDFRGLYVPAARVQHLPPESTGPVSPEGEYRKHLAMLQNIAYTALRLPHGRRIARTIPGNWLRFLRSWPLSRALTDSLAAFWKGAILGRPAGWTAKR